jgi:hypothetical protein
VEKSHGIHTSSAFSSAFRAPLALVLVFQVLVACQGQIGSLTGPEPDGTNPGGKNPPSGASDPGGAGGQPGSNPPTTNPDGSKPDALDVNRVPIHRLNNDEYDNTMRDLLGTKGTPGRGFIEDEKAFGFDVIASAFGMTDAQFEQYFNAADSLVEEAFGNATLKSKLFTCTTTDGTCVKKVITDFGLRAWRRPLTKDEVDELASLQKDAAGLGEDFAGSMKHVVKTMLSSVPFLYRVEIDSDPSSAAAHALGSYEMASRLSYLLWSTMPDQALFDSAKKGDLAKVDGLSAELARMLADDRAKQFVTNFAGQWLGMRDMQAHQVEPSVFPSWNEKLRTGMVQEGFSYFDEFLSGDRDVNDFFTADVNFVTPELASLYGVSGGSSTGARITNTEDPRRGFLGLAGFLTMTSFSYRTAPTLRGKWVLENLLCVDVKPPPANVPKLDAAGADPAALQSENVRERLEAHRQNPTCNNCHKILDPIGLGLENFDGIGKYRTKYENGDTIDASGVMPDGAQFSGITELSTVLSADERFADCVSKKMLTYALSREVVDSDAPYLKQIRDGWTDDGYGLTSLLQRIVSNDTFRFRRGESQ